MYGFALGPMSRRQTFCAIGCTTLIGILASAFLALAPSALAQGTIGSVGISGGAPPGADPAAMLFNRPLNLGTGSLTVADPTVASSKYAGFGAHSVAGIAANCNSLFGMTDNTLGGANFPTGVTGYGLLESTAAGGQVFGMFARADAYAAGTTQAEEFDCFNFASSGSTQLPPDSSIGTAQVNCKGLVIVPYGNYASSLAVGIGGGTQTFQNGIYVQPGGVAYTALEVDATATSSPQYDAILKNSGGGLNLILQTMGSMTAGASVLDVRDAIGTAHASIRQNGDIFGNDLRSIVKVQRQVATVAAAGTTQGTATALSNDLNVVNSGTGGVILQDVGIGTGIEFIVTNSTASAVNVYPPSGGTILGLAQNAAYSLAANATHSFIFEAAGTWGVQ